MGAPNPTLYGSFNARQLSPGEVGETFVPPAQFYELCQAEHTLLLGPRGSGKTTLLKMLTEPAQRVWRKRTEVSIDLPFKAIYIPADILWTSQVADIVVDGAHVEALNLLSRAAVTANVLYAFAEAVEQMAEALNRRDKEVEVCRTLSESWTLGTVMPSFAGIRQSLRRRLVDVRSFVSEIQHDSRRGQASSDLPRYVHANYFDLVVLGAEITGDVYSLPRDQRWALCFDELEIGPDWLRKSLTSALRSSAQRFLFKLSASPLQSVAAEEVRPSTAQERDDYRVVKLWYSGSVEARPFCENITTGLVQRVLGEHYSPNDVFGSSRFAQEGDGEGGTYRPGAPFWRDLRQAVRNDESLRKLLEQRGIDVARPTSMRAADRDQVLRKIKPTLMLRNEFRRDAAGALRTRKRLSLYTGTDAIYALSDGNPRWLIGMLRDMLPRARSGRVSRSAQADVVTKASHRYKALLGMLPKSTATLNGRELPMVEVLDRVGKYFFDRLVRGPFPLDPVGSFIVDSGAQGPLLDLIGLAVSQGALIYVDPEWMVSPTNPRGKRFRLSFLLSPTYRLPLRLYDAVPLSVCMGKPSAAGRHGRGTSPSQADLFGGTL